MRSSSNANASRRRCRCRSRDAPSPLSFDAARRAPAGARPWHGGGFWPLTAAPAGAKVVTVPTGSGSEEVAVGLQPRDAESASWQCATVESFDNPEGNPVVHKNETYAIYWDPTDHYHGDWQHLIDTFLQGLGADSGSTDTYSRWTASTPTGPTSPPPTSRPSGAPTPIRTHIRPRATAQTRTRWKSRIGSGPSKRKKNTPSLPHRRPDAQRAPNLHRGARPAEGHGLDLLPADASRRHRLPRRRRPHGSLLGLHRA